ncbi:hypothetical protein E4U54_000542 [Claviceps lovelessii]|nr:hypothetical protein E4U54_000542 [Claviceps lovelessii]
MTDVMLDTGVPHSAKRAGGRISEMIHVYLVHLSTIGSALLAEQISGIYKVSDHDSDQTGGGLGLVGASMSLHLLVTRPLGAENEFIFLLLSGSTKAG